MFEKPKDEISVLAICIKHLRMVVQYHCEKHSQHLQKQFAPSCGHGCMFFCSQHDHGDISALSHKWYTHNGRYGSTQIALCLFTHVKTSLLGSSLGFASDSTLKITMPIFSIANRSQSRATIWFISGLRLPALRTECTTPKLSLYTVTRFPWIIEAKV